MLYKVLDTNNMKTTYTNINSQKAKIMKSTNQESSERRMSKFTALFTMMLSLAAFLFTSCKSATAAVAENRLVNNNFYGVILKANAQVILRQGNETSVRIEGDENSVSSVETTLDNGALLIQGTNDLPVTIYVTMDEISLIEVNGTGKIFSNDVIYSDILLLKVVGSGSIQVDVRSLSLGMIVKGNGKIYAKGSTGDSYTRVLGSGQVVAMNLDSVKITTEASTDNVILKRPAEYSGRHGSSLRIRR
jgi:hypothetical protein